MMSEQGETSLCSNCKRQIAVANYTMHTLHCHKNIVLCDICEEPVPRTQLQQHQDELHALVKCDACGLEVGITEVEKHNEQLCVKRDVKCPICEIETPFDAYADHLDYCESRTQLCPTCNQYIMQRDWDEHESSACQLPKRPSPPVMSSPTIAEEDVMGFPRENSFVNNEMRRLAAPTGMPFTFQSILTAPEADVPMERDDTVLPCEFCNALLPPRLIFMHQSNCPQNPESLEPQEHSEHLTGALRDLHFVRPSVVDRGDLNLPLEEEEEEAAGPSSDEPMLPCEFCEELVAMSQLVGHQAECPQDLLRSARGVRTPVLPLPDAPKAQEAGRGDRSIDSFLRPIGRRPAAAQATQEVRPSASRFRAGMWHQDDPEPPQRNTRIGVRRNQPHHRGGGGGGGGARMRAANRQGEQNRAAGTARQTGNYRQQKPSP